MAKIIVDQNLCIGCGLCVSTCPECFELKEDGKSYPKADECDNCNIEEVILDCPVQAISKED